jgi:hypothetical protein
MLLLFVIITFMQGIYNYLPETNNISRVYTYSVAAILCLQFFLHVMLFPPLIVLHFYISTSRNMCSVYNMAVFCSFLISCSPGTLLRYCLSEFKMVPVAPIVTGITCAFAFHMR